MPSSATFRSWAARVPHDFVFAVKASRYLTHVRRLKEPRPAVERLVDRASELGSHLGPILLQLPPNLELDLSALETTLDAFPAGIRLAVEPRHDSWFVEDVRRALTERNVALCLADRRGPASPFWRTADWIYLRFHAGRAAPQSCYRPSELEAWVERLQSGRRETNGGFVYFNNDRNGCALRDASVFGQLLNQRGLHLANLPVVPEGVLRDPRVVVADAQEHAPIRPGRT